MEALRKGMSMTVLNWWCNNDQNFFQKNHFYCSSVIPHNVDTSALQPITLPVMNSLVSTNKVVVDASIDTDMVPEFPSDATQNPLDYIHKADPG